MKIKKQTKAISLLLAVMILLTSQSGTLLAMEVTEQQAFADEELCAEAETVSIQDDSSLPIAEDGNLETTLAAQDDKQTETDVSAIQEEQAQPDSSTESLRSAKILQTMIMFTARI